MKVPVKDKDKEEKLISTNSNSNNKFLQASQFHERINHQFTEKMIFANPVEKVEDYLLVKNITLDNKQRFRNMVSFEWFGKENRVGNVGNNNYKDELFVDVNDHLEKLGIVNKIEK